MKVYIILKEEVELLKRLKTRLYSGEKMDFDERRDIAKALEYVLNNLVEDTDEGA